MRYLTRMSPTRAFKDLRLFFAERGPIELAFLVAAMAITLSLIYAFARDSNIETEYRPDIIYVEQYTLDRTDEQIVAQQKVDQVEKRRRMAEIERRAAERQASFKRLDDKLKSYGF